MHTHTHIYGPQRGEVTGEWRKLHNEYINDPYCSFNIVRVIKERFEIGRACSTYGGDVYKGFWWGNLRKRDPGVNGIILRCIFWKWIEGDGLD